METFLRKWGVGGGRPDGRHWVREQKTGTDQAMESSMGKPEGTGEGWDSGMTQGREGRILKSVSVVGAVGWGFCFPTSLKGGHMAKERMAGKPA